MKTNVIHGSVDLEQPSPKRVNLKGLQNKKQISPTN